MALIDDKKIVCAGPAQEVTPECEAGVFSIIHGQELSEEILDLMKEKDITFCSAIQFLTLAKAGLTPIQMIMAANKNGAEALKIDGITGTVESANLPTCWS